MNAILHIGSAKCLLAQNRAIGLLISRISTIYTWAARWLGWGCVARLLRCVVALLRWHGVGAP